MDFTGATDVSGIADLDGASFTPVTKTLLWAKNLGRVSTRNFEGITLGPALPLIGSTSGNLALTFNRNVTNTDLILTVQAADSLDGPWTDLAQSVDGAPFIALQGGVAFTETGTGATRGVAVRDLFSLGDPAHPSVSCG